MSKEKSYVVFVNRVYRETMLVTASSEQEARKKVLNGEYDDVIDTDPMDEVIEDGMIIELEAGQE